MNKFLSLCALVAILMVVLATVQADIKKDMAKMKEFEKKVKDEFKKIKTFVAKGLKRCEAIEDKVFCDSLKRTIETVLYGQYDPAFKFIWNYKDELESKRDSFKPSKLAEGLKNALNEMITQGNDLANEIYSQEGTEDSISRLRKISHCWEEKKIHSFRNYAYDLYKKYAS